MGALELAAVCIFGLFFFLLEEFRDSTGYAVTTVVVSVAICVAIAAALPWRRHKVASWCLLGGIQASLASILRPALVYGAPVLHLQGVDCFDRLGLDGVSYVLFAISGALAGRFIAAWDVRPHFRWLPLLGIVLGVLYHFKLAQGFWTAWPSVNGTMLFVAEFLAPTVYGFLMAMLAGKISERRNAYTQKHVGPRDRVGNKGGTLGNRLRAVMAGKK
jgi:hypothetical protein